ncbi:putative membrane protein [Mucilaginibacter sp. UYCu711]
MKSWKIVIGVFFIIIGVLFFMFLRALNDPELRENQAGSA